MSVPVEVAFAHREVRLGELALPFSPSKALGDGSSWEVEIGFGKGRHLLQRALTEPTNRFLGVEVVSEYYRILRNRARKRRVENLLVARAEALYFIDTILEPGFADAVHIYFPDPWPKAKHQRRRLMDPRTVDLVLRLLRPQGRLFFATDFLEYGEKVVEMLQGHPALEVERLASPWPDGARTNYEAKYMEEGRPIIRLIATLVDAELVHPEGKDELLIAVGHQGKSTSSATPRA